MSRSANSDLEQLHTDATTTDAMLLGRARTLAMKLGAIEAVEQMLREITRLERRDEPEDSVRARVARWIGDLWIAGVRGTDEMFSKEDRAAAATVPWQEATPPGKVR